jgi:hypothetical protein
MKWPTLASRIYCFSFFKIRKAIIWHEAVAANFPQRSSLGKDHMSSRLYHFRQEIEPAGRSKTTLKFSGQSNPGHAETCAASHPEQLFVISGAYHRNEVGIDVLA